MIQVNTENDGQVDGSFKRLLFILVKALVGFMGKVFLSEEERTHILRDFVYIS